MNNEADFWFARADIDVVRDKELSITAKFIFTVLCTFADKDNRGCWPGNETVAETAGVSERTLIRAYKELEDRGVIARESRFKNGQQTTSYTLIVGHNAPCYGGVMDDRAGVSSVSDRTRINERDKDSLTGEAPLPDEPQPEIPDSPKEAYTPEDAPDIMRPTAELFLHKTGHKALTWDDISALRELAASQYPSRVQKEIDTAVKRFLKRGQPLSVLTLSYIAGSLKHQPSRNKPKKPKPDQTPQYTDAEIDAVMAENEALQAELEGEAMNR